MNNKDEEKIQELEEKVRKMNNATETLAAFVGATALGSVALITGLALLPTAVLGGIGGGVGYGVYHLCMRARKK
jgi:hypothetical protein